MEAIQWAIGVIVIIQIAVTGFIGSRLWSHVDRCKSVAEKLSRIDADVERMKQDIGTHETGMRGQVHKTVQVVQEHEMTLRSLIRDREDKVK